MQPSEELVRPSCLFYNISDNLGTYHDQLNDNMSSYFHNFKLWENTFVWKKDMHVQHFQYTIWSNTDRSTALSRDDIAKALAKCNTLKTCENHGDLHKYKVSINRIWHKHHYVDILHRTIRNTRQLRSYLQTWLQNPHKTPLKFTYVSFLNVPWDWWTTINRLCWPICWNERTTQISKRNSPKNKIPDGNESI